MKNHLSANISVTNINPHKKHFMTDDGTIVTDFSGSDLFSIHITANHASALVEWAQSIYDTFVENGYTNRLRTYGMFTSAGDNLVRIAIDQTIKDTEDNWTVDNVIDKVISLGKYSNPSIDVGEVCDTAVRECIYEALEDARNSND